MKRILTFILIAVIGITTVNAQTDESKRRPKKQTTTQQAAPAKPKKEKQKPAKQNKPEKQTTSQQTSQLGSTQSGQSNSSQSSQQSVSTQTHTASVAVTTGTHQGHEWVDLGLPSGTKWATTNVGASSPSDNGDYYAWGETSTKGSYDWSNLKYCLDSTGDKFSKYVTDSKYGGVDGKQELDQSDDAAYANWGSGWRMPSLDQIKELKEKCTWTWTSMDGHNGYKVVGKNGNSLFLSAAGFRYGSSSNLVGSYGNYWSRTLSTSSGGSAYYLDFGSSIVGWNGHGRGNGQSVRPVLAP